MATEMKESPTEEKVARALTGRSLVISIISVVLIVTIQMTFEAVGNRTNVRGVNFGTIFPLGILAPGTDYMRGWLPPIVAYMMIPVAITLVLPRKWRLNMQELTLIYASMGPVAAIAGFWGGVGKDFGYQYDFTHMAAGIRIGDLAKLYTPSILGPRDLAVLDPMLRGGAIVPWGSWTTTIVFWAVLYIAVFINAVSGSNLLRRHLIEVESLPYPATRIVIGMLSMTDDEVKDNPYRSRIMAIGLLIGIALGLIKGITAGFANSPYYPNVLSRLFDTTYLSAYDITQRQFGGTLPVAAGFNVGTSFPSWLAMGLLLPFDVLISSLLGYLVLYITIPYIAISVGDMGKLPSAGTSQNIWAGVWNRPYWGFPASITQFGYMPFFYSALIGLALTPIVFHWKAIVSSVKVVFGGPATEIAAEEVKLNKMTWYTWGLSAIVAIAMFMVGGIPMQWAILAFVVLEFIWLGLARLCAETGTPLIGFAETGWGIQYAVNDIGINVPLFLANVRDPAVLIPIQRIAELKVEGWHHQLQLNPMYWSFSSYKISNMNKSRVRDVFTAQIIAIVLSVCIALPLTLYCLYAYGYQRGADSVPLNWTSTDIVGLVDYGALRNFRSAELNAWFFGNLIAGFALTLGIYGLRAYVGGIFSWISPAGFIFAGFASPWVYWLPFVAAIAVKKIALRIGGNLLFERKVAPFAIGLLVGTFIHAIPMMTALYLRGLGWQWF